MADLADELAEYLKKAGDTLSEEEKASIRQSIELLKKSPGVKFTNPDKFDAKDMVPVGQDHPVDWNPKKK